MKILDNRKKSRKEDMMYNRCIMLNHSRVVNVDKTKTSGY